MKIRLQLGGPLQDVAGGKSEIMLTSRSGRPDDVVDSFQSQFPALAALVLNQRGHIRRYVSLYVNGVGSRYTHVPELGDGDVMRVTLLVSGG